MLVEVDIDLEKFRWSLVGDGYIREEVITMTPSELVDVFGQKVTYKIHEEYHESLRRGLIDEDEAVTCEDIFNEFKSEYPAFVDYVHHYQPKYMSSEKGMCCRNIYLYMDDGRVKRYSYETKKLYPVYLASEDWRYDI